MKFSQRIAEWSVSHYKALTVLVVCITLIIALGAALPSIFPGKVAFLNEIAVDTDPENMLSTDEPVRVFHDRMKRALSLYDMVVVGVVNEADAKHGVFTPAVLKNVYDLTEYAKTLRWPKEDDPCQTEGVVSVDVIAPSTVDNIEQGGLGVVKFEWLMAQPPKTIEEAQAIRTKAQRIPFLEGTLVSEDGQAICLYIPLTKKELSYKVSKALQEKIETFSGTEKYHITGLPVAEDTFGVEMFIQMAISAPAAMAVIFVLLLVFFRKLVVILSPMIVAMVSVICTMGLLVGAGFPVHIMSSMIPIFIMPIAVLDSIHIISEFFERYQETRDRRKTITKVMDELFMPMLYTSLTSSAGFASLALTPIPPVQVFGAFVAIGIMIAWILTITFIPAYVMFISPKTLEKFGAIHVAGEGAQLTWMGRLLQKLGGLTYRRAKGIIIVALLVMVGAAYGISRININDNPVKWFTPSHPIRIADKVLNEHFGGTYMAYLCLTGEDKPLEEASFIENFRAQAQAHAKKIMDDYPQGPKVFAELESMAAAAVKGADKKKIVLDKLAAEVEKKIDKAEGETAETWEEAALFLDQLRQQDQLLKQPEVLNYISRLQREALAGTDIVGKSNSLSDIVKTVHRELREGKKEFFTVPDSANAVAQCLITYQSSHRPDDLWHFVTGDYRTTSIWVQLKSGDNKDMTRVVKAVQDFMVQNPPPAGLQRQAQWFGLTYINVIWQDKMVTGMMQAFLGSFLVVFILMTILFRSALWGFLCMIPLTITIGAIYGAVGLIGKDYDMPVAVLSSMTLGLAVDFAIHFLARSRSMYEASGSWEKTAPAVFGEPARAIARNILVIATGFLPLLLAPLMPYKTVGILLATILLVAGLATLLLLPALITVFQKRLFVTGEVQGATCNCATCLISSVAAVILLAISLHQYATMGWTTLTWISVAAVPILAIICGILSRREKCKLPLQKQGEANNE